MALSQMMRFWQDVKKEFPDCMIFFRLGDFYELFFEDAKEASKLLGLTLTGRDCGLTERAPMCGVPYHAVSSYLARLVKAGKRIAICDQIQRYQNEEHVSRRLLEREVVRVISPGTVIENEFLDEKQNNFLACAVLSGGSYALAWTDITTGEFCAAEAENFQKVVSRLVNLSVSEIICNDAMFLASKDCSEVERGILPAFTCYSSQAFDKIHAIEKLQEQFLCSFGELGLNGKDACLLASGALLAFLNETQKHALKNINKLSLLDEEKCLKLDSIAVRNLEILKNSAEGKRYGSLLWLLDKTKTGMGARKLSSMLLNPPLDKTEIDLRLDAVGELYTQSLVRMGLAETLSSVRDVERLAGKISNGNLQPRDCVALSSSLKPIPNLKLRLSGLGSKRLREVEKGLADPTSLCALLDSAFKEDAGLLRDGNFIKLGFRKELDELLSVRRDSEALIANFEARERTNTGVQTLKVRFNRAIGYFIEAGKTPREKLPENYRIRQSLANSVRYTTEELKDLEDKILNCEEKISRLEESLFQEIYDVLEQNIKTLQSIAESLATLDCLVSLATVAKENRYVRPEIALDGALEVEEGRHAVVEQLTKERFVPNDCVMDGDSTRTIILTGPNMAGKSTYLRQVALIVLMAHIGSFVPAKRARIPLCDRIFTRIGASDNLIQNQSTFMVEMSEVAGILRGATQKSLLILDEVGRGTSTFDGLAIAWSVIRYLNQKIRAKTLFATHYHELTELEGKLEGVKNFKIGAREANGSIVFMRKIVRGGASRSFGVEVASLAGVPEEVTSLAKQILRSLEKNDLAKRGQASFLKEEDEDEEPLREEGEDESALALKKEVAALDVNLLTPMQALSLLYQWKEKYK